MTCCIVWLVYVHKHCVCVFTTEYASGSSSNTQTTTCDFQASSGTTPTSGTPSSGSTSGKEINVVYQLE